jgi:hypothetical protein
VVENITDLATDGLLAMLLASIVYFVAATAHERSHWLVGRLWSDDVTIIHLGYVFPFSVDFQSPNDVPRSVIRVAGIAPFLFCLPIGVVLFTTIDASFLVRMVLSLPFWAAAILSPSDLLAICYPTRFQELAAEHERMGHLEVLDIVIAEASG